VPLALFIIIGLAYVEPSRLTTLPPITLQQSLTAGLLLIFIYGGYEVVPVPAGESLDPRRDVPFAMVATIGVVMIVMTLAQIVAQGVLANVADHATPIADAAAAFLGATGALLIGIGSVISMTGNNAGQVLSGSRMLFALAEQGQLPAFLARVHSRYRTPANAIVFTSAVALTLALSGSFAQIALVSALARLLMYAGSAAATLRLRASRFTNAVKPAGFTAPFGLCSKGEKEGISLPAFAAGHRYFSHPARYSRSKRVSGAQHVFLQRLRRLSRPRKTDCHHRRE